MKQLQQQWSSWAGKIDKLSLRERGIILLVLMLMIVLGANTFFIDPQFLKQKALAEKIKQEQAQILAIQSEIVQKINIGKIDPDAENKQKLQAVQQQLAQIEKRMQLLQKGLIAPEKMTSLLENILKRNQKLQLVSLKTLPVSSITDGMDANLRPALNGTGNVAANGSGNVPANATATAAMTPPSTDLESGAIYKHGFEIVVQGNYLDMLSYMRELEEMPEQVYWSKTRIHVDHYPTASMTLTLFTLSLEKKWLNL
ncbi:MSHA biogenesis protein MshJ [Undibacterium sp. Jales W-56]|uniref:MSHA biogenesis protein MshJ n=1 Tax=Undibacterium sp. Jales W-56 TaxID=2897325 RepID=UPI0021D0A092|nr:MSHA biogenesis protein MshJ [Undibacterium sp. Jales W-56]MCU6432701.1 MSHA biogenesis protein MshJ [Undibacterium sp. Jales W-56]